MNDKVKLSERFSASLRTAVYGAPVSYLIRLVLDYIFRASGGIDMAWIFAGIAFFALLGFLFPRSIGQVLRLT